MVNLAGVPDEIMGSLQELDDVFFPPNQSGVVGQVGEMSHVFLA